MEYLYNLDVIIGSKLRELRNQNNLTLLEVAKRIGCSKVMMHYYETGRTPVSVAQLKKTCAIYGTNYIDFLQSVDGDPNGSK